MLNRRSFLSITVVTLGSAALPGCGDEPTSTTGPRVLEDGADFFPQSVASGDPKPTSVILWTRVHDVDRAGWDLDIELEVALDKEFTKPVLVGGKTSVALKALAAYDNCVKARLVAQPGETYYYRFIYEKDGQSFVSRVGRTKTAPAADADVPVTFAYVSCQDFLGRYYNTYLALAQEKIDFFVHLGDYVYETTGDPTFQTPDDKRKVSFTDTAAAIELSTGTGEVFHAAKSLDNYRDLYRIYRGDKALQAVHELFPMIALWDDHEFSNDCWGSTATYLNGKASEDDVARRKAADQAWFEYLPVDYPDAPDFQYDPKAAFPGDIRIYRDFVFGKHVHVVATDLRAYRPDHLIPEDAFPGAVIYDEAALTASPMGLPGPEVATPYIPIETFAGGAYKAVLSQVAMASGYDPTKITGNVSVHYINAVVTQINAGPTPPDPLIPLLDSTMPGLPRGLSYFDLNKSSFYTSIGSRYFVHKDAFDVFAALRFAEDPKSQDLMGAVQEKWFIDTMKGSTSTWKIWANEFAIVPVAIDLRPIMGIPAALQKRFYMGLEGWDGVPQKRNQILEAIAPAGNVVAITGDLHTFLAATPWSSNDPSARITEIVTSSISSSTWKEELVSQVKSDPVLSSVSAAPLLAMQIDSLVLAPNLPNPSLAYAESASQGYCLVEVSADEMVITMNAAANTEVFVDYSGKTADFMAKVQKTKFKTMAGATDLYREIDGVWKKFDPTTGMWG